MENNIVTWQQDYVNGPQPNYTHHHVLRDYITDGWVMLYPPVCKAPALRAPIPTQPAGGAVRGGCLCG